MPKKLSQKSDAPFQNIDDILDFSIDEVIANQISLISNIDDKSSFEGNILPPDIEEFMESKDYLNLKYNPRELSGVYPEVKNIILDLSADDVREGFITLGKGSGKSVIGEIMPLHKLYWVSKLKNPQRSFGLLLNTPIFAVNVSVGQKQAKDIIFSGIKEFVTSSKKLKSYCQSYSTTIHFPKKIFFYSGHSNFTAFLGYPTIIGVLDEVNYMIDNQNRSVADQLSSALRGSLKTRFPNFYKLIHVSSDAGPTSFMRESIKVIADKCGVKLD